MITKHRKARKIVFGLMYASFLVAGVLAANNPSTAITEAFALGAAYLWAVFLIIGGGLSLGSLMRGSWGGEFIGLPLLVSGNWVFGLAIFHFGTTSTAMAVGFMFLAIGFGLLGRWYEVRQWLTLGARFSRREGRRGTP